MGRAPCCEKNGLKKGPWTPEEDHKLVDYIQKHGYGNWRTLPKNAGLQRCGKSCRLRWSNYLRPDIKRGRFSFEEEETIIQLHSLLGNKWSAIAARLPGRTDNEIKNYWNTHIRKRLLRMGIDPVTHSPRLDLLDLSSLLSSTLYPNSSQMNLSNLLGLQPLLNPELLRIVCLLFPSPDQSENSPNYYLQNLQQIPQLSNNIQTQNQALLQNIETQYQDIPQISSATQLMEHLPSDNFTNCSGSTQLSDLEWLRNNSLSSYECYLESEQNVVDLQPQNSKLAQYPYNDSNFTFPNSVLSTPPSSPSHLNSNSTHFNCSSTTTEDERESQSSDVFKFEISDILDVEKFM